MAARVAGKSAARISVEHILPNVTNLLIVQGTIQFSLGILGRSGVELRWPWRTTAIAVVGAYAGGCPNAGQHCATYGL